MIQSHIILTQTSLDLDKISKSLALDLFQNLNTSNPNSTNFNSIIFDFAKKESGAPEIESTQKNWDHYFATNQILTANFKDKEDFTDSLMAFYQSYNQPTFLFLGDLNNYSSLLQEGMLRLLEEPPENLNIILYAQNKTEILPTILSRSQTYRLSKGIVLSSLNQNLLEKVKKKLPIVADFCKDFINNKDLVFPDLKMVEREEISFWLWQILAYLEEYYKHQSSELLAAKIEQVLTALSLNNQNLQKKFVLGWLR
jgi:hypothetical protein